MAKKVRRVRRKRRASRPASKDQVEEVAQLDTIEPQTANSVSSKDRASNKRASREGKNKAKLTTEEELREEYAYVVYDLRRIAILAAALFVLLILLNILL